MRKTSTGYETLNHVSNRYVAKRNDLIQNVRHSMSLVEYKIVLYVLSAVQPDDPDDKLYYYQVNTLYRILGEKTDSYTKVKACLDKVATFGFWQDYKINGNLIGERIDLIHSDSLILHFSEGYFELRFSKKIMPYIKQLQEQKRRGEFFTSYQIRNVMLMKHMYSIRIYELIKSYSNNKMWTMEIGTGTDNDLQLRIASTDANGNSVVPSAWKNWADFERSVMLPAKEDINAYTDLKIEYQPVKYDLAGNKHRKFVAIQFGISKKTNIEIIEKDEFIDSRYREIADKNEQYEFSASERIKSFLENREENHKMADEIQAEKELDERADKSQYPAFTHTFGFDFTDKQLNSLIEYACEHIETGTIPWKDRDLWLTNYVGHYKRWIDATPERTKSTPYYRLLDMVEKDYDNYAPKVTEELTFVPNVIDMECEESEMEIQIKVDQDEYQNDFVDEKFEDEFDDEDEIMTKEEKERLRLILKGFKEIAEEDD